jgi:GNAT superfamily N-acetyltransferase
VTATLRPLDQSEIGELAPLIERGYAEDIERNGGISAEAAREKAAEDVPRVLADPAAALYAVEDGGERVGHVWLAERTLQGRRILWIYDVFVGEEFRGRGLGRAALELAAEEARRRGLDRVELNVFGGNEVARRLYLSEGYEEMAVWMGKDVA